MGGAIKTLTVTAFLCAAASSLAGEVLSGIYVPPHDIRGGNEPQGAHLVPADVIRPEEGQRVIDPVFRTVIRRMKANHSHVYSQLQAFSHDNEYVILIDHDSGYHVRRYSDLSPVESSRGWFSAYRWIPGTHKIITLENDPVRFRVFDVDRQEWSTLMELPDFQYAHGPRSYEELSRDGEWTAVYVNDDGDGNSLIVSVNLDEKRIGFSRGIVEMGAFSQEWGVLEPDWVGVSPLGRYVVVQWVRDDTVPASGLELYDIETGEFVRRLYTHHNHSDMGLSPEGREYMATSELASPVNGNFPGLVIHWMDGGEPLHLRPMPWSRMAHLSCQGPDGVVIVSAGGEFDGAYKNEIYAVYLDGSLRRLAHHRSTAGDYWVQPKASASPDGSRVIWSSDWLEEDAIDAYVLENLSLVGE
jgi:hypothetical protein